MRRSETPCTPHSNSHEVPSLNHTAALTAKDSAALVKVPSQ
jgi:hypothetical protein